MIAQSLSACEPDLRTVLIGHVVLCGGGSLFAGLSDRLSAELTRNFGHVSTIIQSGLLLTHTIEHTD